MVFEEMQAAGIEADTVACGALFMVLNKGGHPEQALLLGDTLESRGLKYNDVAYTELLAACNKYNLLYIAPSKQGFYSLFNNWSKEFALLVTEQDRLASSLCCMVLCLFSCLFVS